MFANAVRTCLYLRVWSRDVKSAENSFFDSAGVDNSKRPKAWVTIKKKPKKS